MGCPSHSKPIYRERNRLLAYELSELFVGNIGVLMFLDNCSNVMRIKNKAQMTNYSARRKAQITPQNEIDWIRQNRLVTINAAINLYNSLHPSEQPSLQEIFTTVEQWAFVRDCCDLETNVIHQDGDLYLALEKARDSFVAIRDNMIGPENEHSGLRVQEDMGIERNETRRMERTFEGLVTDIDMFHCSIRSFLVIEQHILLPRHSAIFDATQTLSRPVEGLRSANRRINETKVN